MFSCTFEERSKRHNKNRLKRLAVAVVECRERHILQNNIYVKLFLALEFSILR